MTSRMAKAPGTALIRQAVRTSAAILALSCGATAAAFAQTVPAPAPAAAEPAADSQAATSPVAAPVTAPATTPVAAPATTSKNPFTVDPQTVAQTPPARPPAKRRPLGHYPIIDIVTTFVQPGVPFIGRPSPSNQYHTYDPIDVGGTFRIPITRNIYAAFDRVTGGTINQAVERVINPPAQGGVIYPGSSRDIVLQYRLDEQFGRFLIEEGLSFRHRIYANDGGGVSSVPFLCANGKFASGCTVSSTEHHYGYLGVTYTTPPIKELLRSTFSFNLTGDVQHVDHHVGTLCRTATALKFAKGCTTANTSATSLTVGYIDENPSQDLVYETTQFVTWNIPIDIKHRTNFSLRERWGALNFYENQPFPYRWATAVDYVLTKAFTPGFSLALRHSDYHSIQMGTDGVNGLAPFATFLSPNAIHVGSWDVIGTFHIDTNTWFH